MMSSNIEQNLAISRLCENILTSNGRFVSLLNKNSITKFNFHDDRIIIQMSKSKVEIFFMQRALQTSLSKEFDDLVGPLTTLL